MRQCVKGLRTVWGIQSCIQSMLDLLLLSPTWKISYSNLIGLSGEIQKHRHLGMRDFTVFWFHPDLVPRSSVQHPRQVLPGSKCLCFWRSWQCCKDRANRYPLIDIFPLPVPGASTVGLAFRPGLLAFSSGVRPVTLVP